jgi:hypothetical protein
LQISWPCSLRAFPAPKRPPHLGLGGPAHTANGRLPQGRREPGAGPSERCFSLPLLSRLTRSRPGAERAAGPPRSPGGPHRVRGQGRHGPSPGPAFGLPAGARRAGASGWFPLPKRSRLVSGPTHHANPRRGGGGCGRTAFRSPFSPAQRAATRTAAVTPGFAAEFPAASGPGEQSGLDGEQTDQKGFPSP